MSERLSDLYYSARELATDLADRLDAYDFDAGRTRSRSKRGWTSIYRIKQKFGMEVDELLAQRDGCRRRAGNISNRRGEKIAELKAQMQTLYAEREAGC